MLSSRAVHNRAAMPLLVPPGSVDRDIAEADRLRRARSLAGRDDLAIRNPPIFLIGLDVRGLDALDAVGALFHHAAPSNADLRVALRLERLGGHRCTGRKLKRRTL